MKSAHALILAVTLQFAAVPSARAEPPMDMSELWEDLVRPPIADILRRAQRLEREGDMAAAIEAYEEANLRGGSGVVGVELGLALLRAGRTVAGARQLRAAIMLSPSPHSKRSSEYLLDKLAEAKEKIGTLVIRTNVPKATLEIDGAYRWDYPHLVEIYVEPEKEHKIVARREGYWTAYTTEKVGAGEVKDVMMAMEPQVMQRVVNLPTRVMASVGSGNPPQEESKTLLYVSAAGVGLSLAAGIVGTMVYISGKDNADRDMTTVGTGLIVGGGITMGLSIAGFMVYVATPRPQPQPIINISPALAKNQVGLGLSGAW
jgi:hypothetical protein